MTSETTMKTIKEIFELMFWVPVNISLRRQKPTSPLQPVVSTLDDGFLGINFTTGNASYDWCEDEILITIGPLDSKKFGYLMPGQKGDKILRLLCDYLLPISIDVITKFELNVEEKCTRLADKENTINSTLGVDCYL